MNGLASRWIELNNTSLNTIQVQNNCDKLRSFSMKRRKNKTLYRKSHCLAIEELYFIYLRERKSEREWCGHSPNMTNTQHVVLCALFIALVVVFPRISLDFGRTRRTFMSHFGHSLSHLSMPSVIQCVYRAISQESLAIYAASWSRVRTSFFDHRLVDYFITSVCLFTAVFFHLSEQLKLLMPFFGALRMLLRLMLQTIF